MPSQRLQRVQNLLRSEISTVMQRKLKDPRIGMVTITEVEADADLKNARVFVSVLGSAEQENDTLEGLVSAAGFIRSELMKVLHLRPMPRLEFQVDETLERGAHTLELLEQIADERDHGGPLTEPSGGADPEQ
jgi:ribosome-binding factor A